MIEIREYIVARILEDDGSVNQLTEEDVIRCGRCRFFSGNICKRFGKSEYPQRVSSDFCSWAERKGDKT